MTIDGACDLQGVGSAPYDQAAADLLFESQVVPKLGLVAPPSPHRVFTVIGGPPGSGKSTLARRLGDHRAVQHVSADAVEAIVHECLPDLDRDGEAFGRYGARLVWRLMKRSLQSGHDVCFELATPGLSVPFAQLARRERYFCELMLVALPAAQSRQRLAARNAARPSEAIDPALHDRDYLRWPPFVADAETDGVFDRINVYDGSGRLAYSNHIVLRDGQPQWNTVPAALTTLWRLRLAGPPPDVDLAARIDAEIDACRPFAAEADRSSFEPAAAAARQSLLSAFCPDGSA